MASLSCIKRIAFLALDDMGSTLGRAAQTSLLVTQLLLKAAANRHVSEKDSKGRHFQAAQHCILKNAAKG